MHLCVCMCVYTCTEWSSDLCSTLHVWRRIHACHVWRRIHVCVHMHRVERGPLPRSVADDSDGGEVGNAKVLADNSQLHVACYGGGYMHVI
jgi:hypothetical protein